MERSDTVSLPALRLLGRALPPEDDWDTALAELGALLALAAERGVATDAWITLDGVRPATVAVTMDGPTPEGLLECHLPAGRWTTAPAVPLDGTAIGSTAHRLRSTLGLDQSNARGLLRIADGRTADLFVGPVATPKEWS